MLRGEFAVVKTFLVGDYADATATYRQWYEAYHLAQRYGWKPAGTVMRGCVFTCPCMAVQGRMCRKCRQVSAAWNGSYLTLAGQIVMEPDAIGMATALREAMKHVPDDSPPWRYTSLSGAEGLPVFERFTIDLLEYWSTQSHGHEVMQEIVNVAESGEFRIHGKL
jgi:hypothetical protein